MSIEVDAWQNASRILELTHDYMTEMLILSNISGEKRYVASPPSEKLYYTIFYDPDNEDVKILEKRNLIYDTVTEAQEAAILMIQALGGDISYD